MRRHSLADVAAVYLSPEWKDSVRWLSRRLNSGEISGYKVGRVWRMTDADVAAFVESRPIRASPWPILPFSLRRIPSPSSTDCPPDRAGA